MKATALGSERHLSWGLNARLPAEAPSLLDDVDDVADGGTGGPKAWLAEVDG